MNRDWPKNYNLIDWRQKIFPERKNTLNRFQYPHHRRLDHQLERVLGCRQKLSSQNGSKSAHHQPDHLRPGTKL